MKRSKCAPCTQLSVRPSSRASAELPPPCSSSSMASAVEAGAMGNDGHHHYSTTCAAHLMGFSRSCLCPFGFLRFTSVGGLSYGQSLHQRAQQQEHSTASPARRRRPAPRADVHDRRALTRPRIGFPFVASPNSARTGGNRLSLGAQGSAAPSSLAQGIVRRGTTPLPISWACARSHWMSGAT